MNDPSLIEHEWHHMVAMSDFPSETRKPRIVAVDDEPQVLKVAKIMLMHGGNDVVTFDNGTAALEAVDREPPDLILLDIDMPEMNGFQVCEKIKQNPKLKDIPVIFLSALLTTESMIRGFRAGGVDYITKPYQLDEVKARVGTHIKLGRAEALLRKQKEHLELTVLERTAELRADIEERKLVEASLAQQIAATREAFDYTVFALARAAEANDENTGNHILRVGEFSAILAAELGFNKDFVRAIRLQAILHDVGKIHTHPDILKKAGKLTNDEFETMKEHTFAGPKIIGKSAKLQIACSIALTHHERWDGSGYPRQLAGEQIPIEGRIAALADIYDALRSSRSYKEAFDHDTAYKIITQGDGRTRPEHFDPAVLNAFKNTVLRFQEAYESLERWE